MNDQFVRLGHIRSVVGGKHIGLFAGAQPVVSFVDVGGHQRCFVFRQREMGMFVQQEQNGEFTAQFDRLTESELVVLHLLLVGQRVRGSVDIDQHGEGSLNDCCGDLLVVLVDSGLLLLQVARRNVQDPVEQCEDQRLDDSHVVAH